MLFLYAVEWNLRPLDLAQNFRGVCGGYFQCSRVESLLHVDNFRSGDTTETTRVQAQKLHNFRSDRWISLKVLEEFAEVVFNVVEWNRSSTPTTSGQAIPPTRPGFLQCLPIQQGIISNNQEIIFQDFPFIRVLFPVTKKYFIFKTCPFIRALFLVTRK